MKYGMTLIPLLAAGPALAHPGHIDAAGSSGLAAGLALIALAVAGFFLGRNRALELLLTGDVVGAEQAEQPSTSPATIFADSPSRGGRRGGV